MAKLLSIVLRFVIYLMIILPLLTNIFGGEWYSYIFAFIVLIVLASILEARGLMKRFINWVISFFGVAMKNQDNALSNTLGQTIAPDEKDQECPNCGNIVKIINGKGNCESCGTNMQG